MLRFDLRSAARARLPPWVLSLGVVVSAHGLADDNGSPGQPATQTSEHFEVRGDVPSGPVGRCALAAAERGWATTLKTLDLRPPASSRRIPIWICDSTRFNSACDELGVGPDRWFQGVSGRQASYVLFQPADVEPATWSEDLIPTPFVSTVTHEACHLTLEACGGDRSVLPRWFFEGLAVSVEGQVLAQTVGGDPSSEPSFSEQMFACQRLEHGKRMPDVEAILGDRLDNFKPFERYSVYWAIFEFFRKLGSMGHVSALLTSGQMSVETDTRSRLLKVLGVDEESIKDGSLDRAFGDYVRSFAPKWHMYGGSLGLTERCWIQYCDSAKYTCEAWRIAPVVGPARELTGSLEFLTGGARAYVLVSNRAEDTVAVMFGQKSGVEVWKWTDGSQSWSRLAANVAQPVGRRVDFRIRVSTSGVSVFVGQVEVLAVGVASESLGGPWGLGVQDKATVLWHDVVVAERRE